VLAWRVALESVGIELSVWRIHRRIGMSGGLFVNALSADRESFSPSRRPRSGACMPKPTPAKSQVRPLRAHAAARLLTKVGVRGRSAPAGEWRAPANLDMLGIPAGVPIVTRDQVEHASPIRPVPRGAERLGVPIDQSVVVGDSVWDLLAARRARALGVGLLSGGYGEEARAAGVSRVSDPPIS